MVGVPATLLLFHANMRLPHSGLCTVPRRVHLSQVPSLPQTTVADVVTYGPLRVLDASRVGIPLALISVRSHAHTFPIRTRVGRASDGNPLGK